MAMTEEEKEMFEKYAVPEDGRLFAEMDFSKHLGETLLDFFAGVKCFDEWAFDIFAKNGKNFLVGGLDSDIRKPNYSDYLKKVKFSDVYRMFSFYSDIARCDYFRVVLKAENVEEARALHKGGGGLNGRIGRN